MPEAPPKKPSARTSSKKTRNKLRMAPYNADPTQSSMYEVIERVSKAQLLSADCVQGILEIYLHTVRDRLIKNDMDYLPGIGTITVSKRDPSLGKHSRSRGNVRMDNAFKEQVLEYIEFSSRSASDSEPQDS